MIKAPQKKPNWSDLTTKDRITLLNWMIEGLSYQTKRGVESTAFGAFVNHIQGKRTFTISGVYDLIPVNSVLHLGHVTELETMLNAEIAKELSIEDQAIEDDINADMQSDIEKSSEKPKQKKTKKKRR